ncbi:MAG TPA: hypothetical protein VHZ54_01730 [Solirubrobacterales bacterium]|jgi:hypothetical protein|nr:hypothetical protein [Solirubrobacterales bacterium]
MIVAEEQNVEERGVMLIYSMSVSVDGFITDREGRFDWTPPSDEQFRFHVTQIRGLGGYLLVRGPGIGKKPGQLADRTASSRPR